MNIQTAPTLSQRAYPYQSPVADVVDLARRNLGILVAVGIICAAGMALLGVMVPQKYEATAQLFIDPRDLQVLDNQVTPQSEAQNIGTTLVETQALVLVSDTLLKAVVTDLSLANDAEFSGQPRSMLGLIAARLKGAAAAIAGGADEEAEPEAVALDKLQKAISVHRIDRSYVIQATISTEQAEKSRVILDTLINIFLNYQTDSRAELANRTSAQLDAGIENLRADVERLERQVNTYKEQNELVDVRGQIVTESQLSDLNTQLVKARVEAARLQSRLDATPLAADNLGEVPEAVASQTLREMRGLLARIRQRKAVLASKLFPQHPDMLSVIDAERLLMREIESELARIRESLSVDYQRAKGNESMLQDMLEVSREKLNEAKQSQIMLREMERKLAVAQSVYDQATKRTKEAKEQARLNTSNIQVISKAIGSRNRVFPPPLPLLVVVGFVLGLLGTFVFLHLADRLSQPRY